MAKGVLYFLPLTHASELLRSTMLGQVFPWLPFAGLSAFGVVFFVGCMVALKKSDV